MKNKDFYDLTTIDILYKGQDKGKNTYDIYVKDNLEFRETSELEPKEFFLNWLEMERKGY